VLISVIEIDEPLTVFLSFDGEAISLEGVQEPLVGSKPLSEM
jgi:hypothetical protein